MWIVFEGIDGSGKTTQSVLLRKSLSEQGYKVVLKREPSGQLWSILEEHIKKRSFNALEEALLFYAMRVRVMENIKRALEDGFVVISDRSFYSSMVYQCAHGLNKHVADILNNLVVDIKPDLVILCDVPATVSYERIKARGESTDVHYLLKLRHMYLELARKENFFVVDASYSEQAVHEVILKKVSEELKQKRLVVQP